MSILEGGLADDIAAALESALVPHDLTVSRSVIPDSPPYDPFDPPAPVLVEYPARGFLDEYDASYRAGSLIEAGDVKVVIVATSIEVEPAPGDLIEVKGKSYSVISVSSDPAGATWSCQARP
ncbi:MAG: hypothetical protein ACOY5F_18900 [Pseudomonadota bacterium]